MADYKELLRKAIEALPENNGAARRAVYEKARAALVGQLRAINPPLAARDITTHRLQLEDCIRQVEQEASEAVIAGMGLQQDAPPPPPVFFTNNVPQAQAAKPAPVRTTNIPPRDIPKPVAVDAGSIEAIIAAADKGTRPEDRPPARPPSAASQRPQPIKASKPEPRMPVVNTPDANDEPAQSARAPSRPLPAIVARAEAAKSRGAPLPSVEKSHEPASRRGGAEPRRDNSWVEQPAPRSAVAARQMAEPASYRDDIPVPAAMSSVREVEVDHTPPDPQHAIDRAIATLDREARDAGLEPRPGAAMALVDDDETPEFDQHSTPVAASVKPRKGIGGMFGGKEKARVEPSMATALADADDEERVVQPPPVARPAKAVKPGKGPAGSRVNAAAIPAAKPNGKATKAARNAAPAAREVKERRGGASAVTVFLLVFLVLLGGAGGAGYWAWQEGYVDLDSMFGRNAAPTSAVANAPATSTPTPAPAVAAPEAVGPGNTATPQPANTPGPELKADERLAAAPAAPAAIAPTPPPAATVTTSPLQLQANGTARVPERLGADTPVTPAEGASPASLAVAGLDPSAAAGSQSLLLEAADGGATGAIPFSGTVDWTQGKDETGAPTLVGKASIPARNMNVDLLIRKNSDPALPASHLMEISFSVPDTFIGGSIAGLPGVLLKNQELVQGVPLVGASARVVGNTFLFALSASPQDTMNNNTLLTTRKWIDLAMIYATGKRAILTLEKDEAADTLFKDVFAAWTGGATTSPT